MAIKPNVIPSVGRADVGQNLKIARPWHMSMCISPINAWKCKWKKKSLGCHAECHKVGSCRTRGDWPTKHVIHLGFKIQGISQKHCNQWPQRIEKRWDFVYVPVHIPKVLMVWHAWSNKVIGIRFGLQSKCHLGRKLLQKRTNVCWLFLVLNDISWLTK